MHLYKIDGKNAHFLNLQDGTIVLFSYETPVAAFIPGVGYFRTSEHFSRTTSSHINAWITDLPCEERPQNFFHSLLAQNMELSLRQGS